MEQFFNDFGKYCTEASYGTFWFWGIPIVTVLGIWLLTTIGMKVFRPQGKLKTAFMVNKAWIICSLFAAFAIITIICYRWSQNIFAAASEDYRLSWLIALIIAMVIPIIAFFNLRRYYNQEGIKEVTDQPTTKLQLDATIPLLKRAFERIKWFYIIPVVAFFFLLFLINKGTNLISIVYDNSISNSRNAIDALSETFSSLEENNEIVLTTLDGVVSGEYKNNIAEIMAISQSAKLNAGKVVFYNNPKDAMNGAQSQLSIESPNSPISESIWKMWLQVTENKINQSYKNKLLIVITDGDDQLCSTLQSGRFFFDDNKFAEYFSPDNVFVIDYSGENKLQFCNNNYFIQRFETAGCNIYPAENSKNSYLDALDEALQSFKNNWNIIFWTIFIVALFTIIALLIPPKKII
jgi:hypothetical protein